MLKERDEILFKAAASGDEESKNRLVEQNTGLVKSIAKRFFKRGYEPCDIIQLGMLGLYKAIMNFDISYNVSFSTYAVPLIAGEIKRFLRDDGLIKISRSIKENAILLNEISASYEKENGVSPSISTLCNLTKIPEEDVIMALNSTDFVTSLDMMIDNESDSALINKLEDRKNSFEDEIVERVMLKNMLSSLKPKERQVITLRYFSHMTQSEVSKIMGVSQVQISRTEKKVLDKLRKLCINSL